MNVHANSAPNASATPLVPVLRTVLLADVVDSTAFLQRLGDARAAALLQRLELHLRDLLAATHGQFIDKADGVLALFERPVHAVDFALRYQKLLAELGAEYGEPGLCARIGIHVGEVMTWANDPRAVAAGAKPIEVEGLAKPVAARLMALALPGQVLLSGMAQTLALRAISELGDRGERLKWVMHGRYRFKGVPAPMLVHEAGEAGLSPLRAPPSGQKGRREVPLWRRPPMLALEALLVAGAVAASVFTTFRSEPALAFYRRDWIVVGNLNNLTDQHRLTEPLETALRVGLQQSSYVVLVPDSRVEQTLERMGRDASTPVDRNIGSEIAAREGARAVLLPTLTDVGGRLEISLEVVDPKSKLTVFSDKASAPDARELLGAVDDVLARMRGRLGESVASIEDSSEPLEEVTTSNIEALRAYSLGLQARNEYRIGDAFALQKRALELDPDFALAHAALASLYFTNGDNPTAFAQIQAALKLKDKLTLREKLYLDAVAAVYSPLDQLQGKWKMLAAMYPEEYRAHYNYAYFSGRLGFDQADALDFLDPALDQHNPARVNAYFLRGSLLLALDRQAESLAAFHTSESLGLRGYKGTYAAAYGATRDYDRAVAILAGQEASGESMRDQEHQHTMAALEADQGRIGDAIQRLRRVRLDTTQPHEIDQRFAGTELTLRSYLPDAAYARDLADYVRALDADFAATDPSRKVDLAYMLLGAAQLAARNDNPALADQAIERVRAYVAAAGIPLLTSMLATAQAELAMANGEPEKAIDLLALSVESGKATYNARAVLMRASAQAGDRSRARQLADWLATHRGLAYAEFGHEFMWQPANVIESDLALYAAYELAKADGDEATAKARLEAFEAVWKGPDAAAVAAARAKALAR
jgi:putative peptide modification system cyclase